MFRWWSPLAVRPTAQGVGFALLVAGVAFAAVNTGNNLIYFVLSLLFAMLIVSNVLAEWNLRGLSVHRHLSTEIRAGEPAGGTFVLVNHRRLGTAWVVEIEERGAVLGSARVRACRPGESEEVSTVWTFPGRGVATLDTVRLRSLFPFGVLSRHRDVSVPADVLVYPAPARGLSPLARTGHGIEAADATGRADIGDFAGLRPYTPGDPIRRVHWPTSARTGSPMVVVRTGEGAEEVVLRVDSSLRGSAREDAIRRAAGRIDWHVARGDAVGLDADGERSAPVPGPGQRRRLLTRLALLAVRP